MAKTRQLQTRLNIVMIKHGHLLPIQWYRLQPNQITKILVTMFVSIRLFHLNFLHYSFVMERHESTTINSGCHLESTRTKNGFFVSHAYAIHRLLSCFLDTITNWPRSGSIEWILTFNPKEKWSTIHNHKRWIMVCKSNFTPCVSNLGWKLRLQQKAEILLNPVVAEILVTTPRKCCWNKTLHFAGILLFLL